MTDAVEAPLHHETLFVNCHPERSEEAQPTNAVEGSAVCSQREALPLQAKSRSFDSGGKNTPPPLRMTIRKE